ncbi:MAG: ABC transporter substrate-binding protein [bacterium]
MFTYKMRQMICLGLTVAFVAPVWGDELKKVDQLIRETVDQVLTVVRNNELNADEKVEKVMDVVIPVFDLPLMAKLTLGKINWPKFSVEQREKFTGLFVTQLRESYLGNVEMVADEEVEFEKPFYKSQKAHMMTRVITKEDPVEILYKLYFKEKLKKWLVYDVEIQGISIVTSYGMQYDQVLQKGTVEELLQKMEERTGQNKKEIAAPEEENHTPQQQ